jgi:hypothetical protein
MAFAALALTVIGLIVSVVFNFVQYKWRQQDRRDHAAEKAEQALQEQAREAARRLKEEAPPQFYNLDGTPSPIKIVGMRHDQQGPFMDSWSYVTIVNPINSPMKISLLRLTLGVGDCRASNLFFRAKSDLNPRLEKISLRGNDKEDYELHFMFPDNNYPSKSPRTGQLWVSSDNRTEPFSVDITYR